MNGDSCSSSQEPASRPLGGWAGAQRDHRRGFLPTEGLGWVDAGYGHQAQVGWVESSHGCQAQDRLGGHQSWTSGSDGLRGLLLWTPGSGGLGGHQPWMQEAAPLETASDLGRGGGHCLWKLVGVGRTGSRDESPDISLRPGTASDAQLCMRAETSGRITLGRCLLTAGHSKCVLGTPGRGPASPP